MSHGKQDAALANVFLGEDRTFVGAVKPYLDYLSLVNNSYFPSPTQKLEYAMRCHNFVNYFSSFFQIPEVLGTVPRVHFPKWSFIFTAVGIASLLLASPRVDENPAFVIQSSGILVIYGLIFSAIACVCIWGAYREIFEVSTRNLRAEAIFDLRAQARRLDEYYKLD